MKKYKLIVESTSLATMKRSGMLLVDKIPEIKKFKIVEASE